MASRHATIAFGMVVVERDRKVVEEGGYKLLPQPQTNREVLSRGDVRRPTGEFQHVGVPKPQHTYCVYYTNYYANMSDPC